MQQDAWHALDRLATLVENLHALGGSFDKTIEDAKKQLTSWGRNMDEMITDTKETVPRSPRGKLLAYGNLGELYETVKANSDPATVFNIIQRLPATGKENANVILMFIAIMDQRAELIEWLLNTGIYKKKNKTAESIYHLSKDDFESKEVEFFYDDKSTGKRVHWNWNTTLREFLIEKTNGNPSNPIYQMFSTLVEPAWV